MRYSPESCFTVKAHHYDLLRDALDRGDKGWLELESTWGDGRVLLRVEDVADVVLSTPLYCEERNAWETKEELR